MRKNIFRKLVKEIRNYLINSKLTYSIIIYVFSILFYIYFCILKLTSSIKIEVSDKYSSIKQKPLIFAFWHGRSFAPLLARKYTGKASVLLSKGKDGDLIAFLMKIFNVGTVRGSTGRDNKDKGGASSFREMLNLLKNKEASIAISPDGPIGPRMRVHSGTPILSLLTNVPVVPVSMSASRKVIFKTWDHYCLPLPFSKIVIKISNPIFPRNNNNKKKSTISYLEEIETTMIYLTQQLDKLMKGAVIYPANVDKKNNTLKRKID